MHPDGYHEACRFLAAVDAMIGALGHEDSRALREDARTAFEARTGAFCPEDPWFEARSRAFIDDALTRKEVLSGLAPRLPPEAQPWLEPFARAHRGLFTVEDEDGDVLLVRDLYSGVELYVTNLDESTEIALDAARGLFDARLVGFADPPCVGVLPGPVFHAEESTPHITEVVMAAKAMGLPAAEALDALLRMEHKYRSLSRMKPAYAYKKEALAPARPAAEDAARGLGGAARLRSRLTKDPDSGT
jgi:hypothetical protein